jgi:hypothetical protein
MVFTSWNTFFNTLVNPLITVELSGKAWDRFGPASKTTIILLRKISPSAPGR